jgi:hypothetical protein
MDIETDLLTGQRTLVAPIPLTQPPATCLMRTTAEGVITELELTLEGLPDRFQEGGDYWPLIQQRNVDLSELVDFPPGASVKLTLGPAIHALDDLPRVVNGPDFERALGVLVTRESIPWHLVRLEALV